MAPCTFIVVSPRQVRRYREAIDQSPCRYRGTFVKGKADTTHPDSDGVGELVVWTGASYKGGWIKGHFHGRGRLDTDDGMRYEGKWQATEKEAMHKLVRRWYFGGHDHHANEVCKPRCPEKLKIRFPEAKYGPFPDYWQDEWKPYKTVYKAYKKSVKGTEAGRSRGCVRGKLDVSDAFVGPKLAQETILQPEGWARQQRFEALPNTVKQKSVRTKTVGWGVQGPMTKEERIANVR